MTRIWCVGVVLAVGALPPSVAAEEDGSVRLTLTEAIGRAREVSAHLGQLQAITRASGAALDGARAQRLPLIDVGGAYTRNSDVPELSLRLPDGRMQTLFPNIPDQYRLRAGLQLPIYTGGRLSAGIEAARGQDLAARKDVEAGEHDLVLETATAYWLLVTARESVRVLDEGLAAYESHLKDARNRRDVGMAASNEVLAVQVDRDRAELVRLEAANAASVANADLARLLDLPAGARAEPTEPLMMTTDSPEGEVEALVREAAAGRPEIQALRARIGAAEASVKMAHAAGLPQAGVSAGYDYARPNQRVLPLKDEWNATWSVGFSLSWTAFDGGRTSAAAVQARAQADAAQKRADDAVRRVRLEVTARCLELQAARAALRVAESGLAAARENLRIAQDRYREGLIPSSDLLDAESRLLQAGLDRTSSGTRIRVARARLDRAVGR